MKNAIRIGIDVGGTKTEFLALADENREVERYRLPTPVGDYGAIVWLIAENVAAIEKRIGETATVGIGIPGTVSPVSGRVMNANSTWLNGQPFDADVSDALGRPVRMANDANCFALSEASDGAGQGASSVFGVILGTGVGGGLVIQGEIVGGANAIGGEWGHTPLPPHAEDKLDDITCWCGRRNCVETYLSGPAVEKQYRDVGGESLPAGEIAARAAEGETMAATVWRRYEHRLARGLATVINLFDPEIIVLGGGLSNVASLYEAIPVIWGEFIFSDHVATRLVPPVHGDSSGVRGAARLWPAQDAKH